MKEARAAYSSSSLTIGRAQALARVASVLCTAALIAACGGDSPSGPGSNDTSPVGSFAIATVNGKPLPFTMFTDTNYLYEVTSGSLALTNDGKYQNVMHFRQTIPGNVSLFVDSTTGTWVLNGSTVTLTDAADATIDSAAFAAGKLSFTESNGVATNVYVYSRSK
jgi:hypothetical protein